MPAGAELNGLRGNPQAAYPEYEQIRAEARRRAARPIDPCRIPAMEAAVLGHPLAWRSAVLGYPAPGGGLHGIPHADAEMLVIAHERGLDPPAPAWLSEWQAQSAAHDAARQAREDAAYQADCERSAAAIAACAVAVDVRPNTRGRRHGNGAFGFQRLRHLTPREDAVSRLRRHPAGRALCETEGRARPLQLGKPTGEPATCHGCLTWAPQILPSGRSGK